MSEQLKESLSAVMDGEADEFEIRRVLDETSADAALRGVWDRYHLVGSVLRGEGRTVVASSLSRSFWARIEADDDAGDEVMAGAPERNAASMTVNWSHRLVGVAVAAGVAAAVVVGFGINRHGAVEDALDGAKVASIEPYSTANVPVALVEGSPSVEPAVTQPTAVDMQRLHAYMLHHARQVALTNQARAVPFVKVAAFESQ
jgi:sigma-E factor negative regulatory protein RseA